MPTSTGFSHSCSKFCAKVRYDGLMLADITIENLGVIPRATAELSPGLTVLTGETGAGKTMVVTGLRLLTGGRADASRVRIGASEAVVEGRFVVEGLSDSVRTAVCDIADSAGAIPDENGEFIASRVLKASGRSRAHLGGRSVPAASLAEFSSELLTIHGQNDQLRLLGPDKQLEALDRLDESIVALRKEYKAAYATWRSLRRDFDERTKSRMDLAQEADRLSFAIKEITTINPEVGEDEELQQQICRLQDVDELREQATGALGALDGPSALEEFGGSAGEDVACATDLLGEALGQLQSSSDPALKELGARLADATAIVNEVASELGMYLSGLPADPEELEKLLIRQQELKGLTRKYAPDVAGVLTWLAKAEKRLSSIDVSPEVLEELGRKVAAAFKEVKRTGKALTAARAKAASRLEKEVTEELHGLAMPKARFVVSLSKRDPGPTGCDEVEFLLAANQAAQARPLATSASGGELSRVMLALEVILSTGTRGATLVFDEVDAGVGGRAAVEIGRRLARLAGDNQVIVVTHLPQVAAFADTHLHVSKDVGEESITSGVETLSDERRVEELARMLAGLDDTDTGRAHAQELLDKARAEVARMRVS